MEHHGKYAEKNLESPEQSPEQYTSQYTRMCTKDMLQYCEEALAWEEFGAVDIFFFESVKKILLGQCPDIQISGDSENCSAQKG
ncbi:MAG: hypothetical protein K2H29_01585 [Oscillospiraceae bacterium]|nr:hypothetical protein [Oscillospiraceae bacterium]MDE5883762.1 hypothetical protein [Oscillospiraceae bacterium]